MADVDGRVREWLGAFEPEPNGLERTLERRRRRDRNRRVLSAGLAMVIAAGGLTGAYIAFRPGNEMVQERGFIDPPTCLSEDEPGLITCEEALQRAAEEEGRQGYEVHAKLSFWTSPPPDSERVRVWIVTYEDVVMLGSGPPGRAPNCIIDDWGVVIDARTGDFLVAGNTGKGRPCPSPGETSTVVRPTGITTFEATVELIPGVGTSCTRIRGCEQEFRLTVRNTGQETADTSCFLQLLDPSDSPIWGQDFSASLIEPGRRVEWNGQLNFTGTLDHYRVSCPAYDPGALSEVG